MEEKKSYRLPDEIVESVKGGELVKDWQMIVRMSVRAYKNFLSRNGEDKAKLEDVLAETDNILNSIRADQGDPSDLERDRKLLQDYIKEVWKD